MIRLAKYLKPYLLLLVVAIAFLYVQAQANLALPDYFSKIVNVGIQQQGIENAVPEAMRRVTMDRLLLFLSKEPADLIQAAYTLVDDTSPDYAQYLSKYPALAGDPVYVRRELDEAGIDAINTDIAKAWLVVSGIEKAVSNPAAAAAMSGSAGLDLSKLPAGADPFALLKRLPPLTRFRMLKSIDEKFAAMGSGTVVQGAAATVLAEYKALGANTERLQVSYMLRTGGIMLLLTLLAAFTAIATSLIAARIASGLARDLRAAVFERVESFSGAEFDTFSTASLITRSTNDIMQVQMVAVMMVTMIFYAPIIGVGGVIRAMRASSSMWWLIAAAVGVLLAMVIVIYKVAVPKFKIIQKLMDRLNLVSRESLAGMMVVRAFNRQAHEESRFDKANQDLTGTMLFINRVMVVLMPFMMLLMNGLMIAIIWVGAKQIDTSSLQVGDMMAFMQYAMQIVMAFLMLSMMFIMLPRAAVSAGRVADVLDVHSSIRDPEPLRTFAEPFAPTVEFRGVSFRYPKAEEDVLHDVSFTARPGETTAIIGATGAGKSTIVNLIPRFYDVSRGAILVGGTDVREVGQHDLRAKIGYVPQKATLFSGTIASNLRYADEQAGAEVLRSSVEIAQASEFVTSLAEGMEGPIAQGGANVSGGQKQRLSIARALVRRPPIYLFDDTFSALDFKTDAALRRTLRRETAGSTVLIVTQRIATIMHAEQIIVLDDGRVVGQGTHRDLMERCETYREIATSQLSEEELA
jgi:ATP-binding cassette, subfamily B, multidrug efflux pump